MRGVPAAWTRAAGRAVLKAKHNSPHIFFGAGVAGLGVGTFMACRATLELPEKLEQINNDLEQVKASKERLDAHFEGVETYDNKDYNRDLLYVYVKTGRTLSRLYGPAALVMGVSVAALAGSHIQLTRRNAALAAGFTAISKAFEDYREKVRKELGEEKERELYMGSGCAPGSDCCDDCKVDDALPAHTGPHSPYARLFGEHNVNWTPDGSTNYFFLRAQQAFLNHELSSRGHVLLNDAYDLLKMERTTIGALVGWTYKDDTTWIDFGLDEPRAERFRNGDEPSFWIDFNVHGLVYKEIGD